MKQKKPKLRDQSLQESVNGGQSGWALTLLLAEDDLNAKGQVVWKWIIYGLTRGGLGMDVV